MPRTQYCEAGLGVLKKKPPRELPSASLLRGDSGRGATLRMSFREPALIPNIVYIIGGLGGGGTQRVLCNLVAASPLRHFRFRVISLLPPGKAGVRLQEIGVPTESLYVRDLRSLPLVIPRLIRRLRRHPTDLVHSWNYYGNSLGGVAAALAGKPLIWSLSHSTFTREATQWKTRTLASACGRLSSLPSAIITCAKSAKDAHVRRGYRADRIQVIPNGFDTERFRPDPEARRSVRKELGIEDNVLLIGLLGRFHPDKDPFNFVRAASLLRTNGTPVHFLSAGQGMDWDNRALADSVKRAGLRGRFHLLGWREDAERIIGALDIATSSSCTEAFPNTVGEAMACGVPASVWSAICSAATTACWR